MDAVHVPPLMANITRARLLQESRRQALAPVYIMFDSFMW